MPAKIIFLETGGWLALLNEDDSLHARAVALWREMVGENCSVVLTDWIVVETGNGLARTRARRGFPGAVRQLRQSPRARIVSVTAVLMERALELYEERPDKTWGLVDCASLIVMADEGISEAFMTDRHCEQAGFTCLLAGAGT
jgi:hypothetical protein